ncbi:MAG: winged helix-turn-helix domain-containing protein, partial [Candidatus Dormibacteraeota bacterium]|nr:winged helix-turn-helix domain-containing protein [Candidatus Dormibacteraeota bacterium]
REKGEMPGPVQAACWLDLKRAYMELRPNLRRVYTVLCDLATYGEVSTRLGFKLFPGSALVVDGIQHYAAVNDFGPSSIDGWLSWLLAGELGVDQAEILATPERQLVLEGRRIDLSRLEFDVMQFLYEHEGKPVPRRAIMEAVWGHDVDTASNVLEAVVKSLRKKMGDAAEMIETIRGVGYRFRRLPTTRT